MPILNSQVGAPGAAAPSGFPALRSGTLNDLIVSELHGRYYEATKQQAMFSGSITGVTTTVGLNTTYTGLCLSNPVGSGKNLILNKAGFAFTVVFPAVAAIGLMTGYNSSTNVTHTTPVTPRSQLFGLGATGVGLLDTSATLPTAPTLNLIIGAGLTGATTTVPYIPGVIDLEGSIILTPGAYCAFYTSAVSGTAGASFSFQWEECSAV